MSEISWLTNSRNDRLSDEKLEELYSFAQKRLIKAQKGIRDVIEGYELKAELLEGKFQYGQAADCLKRIGEILHNI